MPDSGAGAAGASGTPRLWMRFWDGCSTSPNLPRPPSCRDRIELPIRDSPLHSRIDWTGTHPVRTFHPLRAPYPSAILFWLNRLRVLSQFCLPQTG